MSVKLVIIDVDILPYKLKYEGNLRRFEPNPPYFKISLEKCSNLDYDYKWILNGWNKIYK